MKSIKCDYCGGQAVLVDGTEVYPHRPDLAFMLFYRCAPCDAYVGCHPRTDRPLGRVANAELRRAKNNAHRAFDPIWKQRHKRRGAAYHWLADKLGIPQKGCHIGMFDVETCLRVIEICRHEMSNLQSNRPDRQAPAFPRPSVPGDAPPLLRVESTDPGHAESR